MSTSSKLLIAALVSISSPALAWPREDFTENGISHIQGCPGVYIIERDGSPYYVGRSIRDITVRLKLHLRGQGSKKVAEILNDGSKKTVEYECVYNMEQMESQLINELGTTAFGNRRRETDPADWDN